MPSKPHTDEVYNQKRVPKGDFKFHIELTPLQKTVIEFIHQNKISVIKADPGCGKTTIAMTYAITQLRKREFDKIVITKPVVEVGSSLGFLPGTAEEKICLHFQIYINAIDQIVGSQEREKLFKQEKVIFKPIQFVRGDNIDSSIIIYDECQGSTLHEAISFITRMKESSKMIVLTDPFQSDIKNTGIHNLIDILSDVEGVGIRELGEEFQMRSPLIQTIYKKYKSFIGTQPRH